MSPVTIVQGSPRTGDDGARPMPAHSLDPIGERNQAERRLSALAEAVRDHQNNARGQVRTKRYHDEELYRRLRQICGTN